MRASLAWIRELLDGAQAPLLSDPDALAATLTARGVAVESIERAGAGLGDVVVARVVSVAPHPNADRLRVCTVDDGATTRQVVCGAPNVTAGRSYPLIRPGGTLPDGRTITPATLRGVTSEGMLMSARECGFGDDHAGIYELTDPPPPGTPLVRALGLDDAVFEFDLTMNRPDCLGVIGIAREVAAACGLPLPSLERAAPLRVAKGGWPVHVEDAGGCPRYTAAVVRDVQHVASPAWLARRLDAHGLRSLGVVVDVTNYVLLEMGHPTHAFDADTLQGGELRVRRARAGERLVTLDGVERALTPDMLVIADRERATALGGVMGGRDTEVTSATRRLVIESAYFDPLLVRRTAKALRLTTDASRRFERGMDPTAPPRALARVVEMLRDLAGGVVEGPATDTAPALTGERDVVVRPARINALLGLDLQRADMADALAGLGFGWTEAHGLGVHVHVPSPRVDVRDEADVAEEIGRAVGYDRIPQRNGNTSGVVATLSPEARLADRVRDTLVCAGLVECVAPVLVPPGDVEPVGAAEPVLLSNALGRDSSALRSSLWPGLLRIAERNRRTGAEDLRFFEIGTVFARDATRALGVRESAALGVVLGGRRAPRHAGEAPAAVDRDDVVGLVESVLAVAGVDAPDVDRYDHVALSAGDATRLRVEDRTIALAGPAGERARTAFGCDAPVFLAWIDLDALVSLRRTGRVYSEPSRFPAVKRDLSLVVPDAVTAGAVRDVLHRAGGRWLVRVELFDVYRGEGLPQGTRSLAFALTFQSHDGTLADAEVDTDCTRIVRTLSETLGVHVRETPGGPTT